MDRLIVVQLLLPINFDFFLGASVILSFHNVLVCKSSQNDKSCSLETRSVYMGESFQDYSLFQD